TTTGAHQIQFEYRLDNSLPSGGAVYAFGDTGANSFPTASSSTWVAFGADGHWAFGDGTGLVDTGVSLVTGTAYTFTILINPAASVYTASVSDGQLGTGHSFIESGLAFRSTSTESDFVAFGAATANENQIAVFSVDSVVIAPPPPPLAAPVV